MVTYHVEGQEPGCLDLDIPGHHELHAVLAVREHGGPPWDMTGEFELTPAGLDNSGGTNLFGYDLIIMMKQKET